jgi:hypothetical protein
LRRPATLDWSAIYTVGMAPTLLALGRSSRADGQRTASNDRGYAPACTAVQGRAHAAAALPKRCSRTEDPPHSYRCFTERRAGCRPSEKPGSRAPSSPFAQIPLALFIHRPTQNTFILPRLLFILQTYFPLHESPIALSSKLALPPILIISASTSISCGSELAVP